MTTAALIVAAGMSSRMGDFKPLLNIGSISIAQRVVATFQQAGVEKIVMVTGYNAVMLERHLAGNGVVFLRNDNYETTQMFDSVRIGLSYLRDKCGRVLFTPVDIPLFTADTVRRLLETDAPLACPAVDGETGHPTLIVASLFDRILSDSGDQGLRGALNRCGAELTLIPVEDRGILHDADTPEDYKALLRYHNEQLARPVLNVELARERVFFDSRTAMLLRLIEGLPANTDVLFQRLERDPHAGRSAQPDADPPQSGRRGRRQEQSDRRRKAAAGTLRRLCRRPAGKGRRAV